MKLFVNGMRVYKRFLLRNPQAKSVVHFGNKVISCEYPAPSWTSGLGTDFISIRLKSPWETCTAAEDGESPPEVKDTFELDMHFYFRTHLDRAKDKDEVKAIASAVEQVTKDLLIEVSNVQRLRTERNALLTLLSDACPYRATDSTFCDIHPVRSHAFVQKAGRWAGTRRTDARLCRPRTFTAALGRRLSGYGSNS